MSGRDEVAAWLGLGGNLGDPEQTMREALERLDGREDVFVTGVSSLYRTPPWGRTDQPDFLNAAAALRTRLSPRQLLSLCLSIERDLKRRRVERWGPRLIDLDILVYGDRAVDEDGLQIPHPRIGERAFVLVPLADIAPDLVIDGVSVAERAGAIERSGIVEAAGPGWWKPA